MKVTFPRMGSLSIPLQDLLQELEIDTLMPPPLTKKTLNLGTKYAPESSCLPFKLVLGNFIEALEEGAEAMIMAGGNGPCRFGHFGELAADILQDLGYEFEFYILEPPVKSIISTFTKLSTDFNWLQAIKALRLAWKKLVMIEEMKKYRLKQGVALTRELSRKIDKKYFALVAKTNRYKKLAKIKKEYKIKIKEVTPKLKSERLKIGLVGDIYTVCEPFANLDIERRLNELGVEIDRAIFVSKWVKNNLIYGALGISSNQKVIEAAGNYLKSGVGGLGRETVGEAVLYGQKGYDGVIQLAPFGCMPEIIAKSLLVKIERDLEIPVLTLTLDEHASATGVQTRIEAFVDLLKQKKTGQRTFLS